MKRLIKFFFIHLLIYVYTISNVQAQIDFQKKAKENARLAEIQFKKTQNEVKTKAQLRNLKLNGYDSKGGYFWLHHFDQFDNPVYYGTRSNLGSATSTRVSRLWNNGGAGLNLEGQSMEVNTTRARLGMWEPGVARLTHVEFGGRLTMRDGATFSGDNGNNKHATHVAGTMMASGVNATAKGMAPQAKMDGYDSNNDIAEMNTAGSEGMLVSNHSYGANLPAAGLTQDLMRGYYDSEAADWDNVCISSPNYLPVQASGNDRDDTSVNMTYDLLLGSSNAKNTLGVGAVAILPSAYTQASDVVMSSFSSYGPTDDGRIKPDVVTPGVAIISSISSGDNQYEAQDGTSMAGPGAAGALFLVQQHYKNVNNGAFMRSSTLRGLAIHTAEEAGANVGPDYGFGWGLLNVERCTQVVSNTSQTHILSQETLANNATFTRAITVPGSQVLKVTICWIDPAATPLTQAQNVSSVNVRTSRLVNDLDLRILDANNNVIADLPWKLNPDNPNAAATKGDNLVDNVEQIYVANLAAGNYTIRVTHKGTLVNAQLFSLIVSGISAPVSAPTITSFTPTSGNVGTSVTITGTNFTGATAVSFNNTNATFNVVSATSITTTVPTGATTGLISVTTAGGTAQSANSFTVTTPTPAPTITSFTPTSGNVGASVTITGTNFTGATAVSFNGTSATFNVASATSITTTVPTGATTGLISVTTAGGTAQSTNGFTVTTPTPAPTITSFTPTSGNVGASVTITGTNFTGATAVSFNGTSATFNVASATSITTTVPTGATTGLISVTTAGGTAQSTNGFTVTTPTPAPTITSFTPTSGNVGASVTITGTNFTGATAVSFNGTSATFNVASATSITTTVPTGATTGLISVTTAGGTAQSTNGFTVTTPTPAPTITSFTPTSGNVGASVTITGTNFTGATAVSFNGISATFNVVSATSITTTVPTGATTGLIRVTTAGGTAQSASNFTVTTPAPTITSFTPIVGNVTTNVTITGTNFTGATAVSFNNTNATFNVVSATSITTTVPTGATTGLIRVTTAGGTAQSATNFTIDPNSLESLKTLGINVFPNPSTDYVTVTAMNGKAGRKVMLYDLQGKIINTQSFRLTDNGLQADFNVTKLSDGQYVIIIEGIGEGVKIIKK